MISIVLDEMDKRIDSKNIPLDNWYFKNYANAVIRI